MKIAFAVGVNDVGGAEYVSYQHIAMAQRNGFEVVVLSGSAGKFNDLTAALGVPVHIVGLRPDVEKIRPLLKGCDLVFNCNSFGITQVIISLKSELGFAYATIIHSNIKWVFDQLAQFDRDADLYYAIHQKIVDDFVRYGLDVDKFRVIPNCATTKGELRITNYELRGQLGISKDDLVIGMVTRIAGDKNIMDAIRIMKRLHDITNSRRHDSTNYKLLIVGGPSKLAGSQNYTDRLMRIIGRFGLTRDVIITGNVDPDDVARYIDVIDIGLNCSPSEGLPIALLEMMGAGKACVFPSVGDIPDVLTGRGVVVPIRQRLDIAEIQADPCYSEAEIKLFVDAIATMTTEQRTDYGLIAKNYIAKERSLECQEVLFINFLNELIMKKKITRIEADCADNDYTDLNGLHGEVITNDELGITINAKHTLPVVTVLMPVRDTPVDYLRAAVDSIFGQDYKGEIELLIVAHDCRMSTLKELVALVDDNSPKIRLIVIDETDVKFSEALDNGIYGAKGSIIVRMDSDDIALPKLVSKVVAYLEANPAVPVCGVQLEFFGFKQMLTNHPPVVTRKMAATIAGHWFVNHPGVAYRKDRVLAVGGYGHTDTGLSEDYHLWCEILKAGGEIHNLPDVLVKYRSVQKSWRYSDGWKEFLAKEKSEL